MVIALFIVTSLLLVATALPLLPWPQWWVRALEFPRPQLAVLAALALVAWVPFWTLGSFAQTTAVAVLVLVVAGQLVPIVPYSRLWRVQAREATPTDPAATLSILVTNVLMENRDADRLRRIVDAEDPDVVLALEPDAWWADELEPVRASRPHVVLRPKDNTYGMLLYSRLPLHDVTVRELTRPDIPSIRAELELADGRRVRLYAVHPPPPMLGHAPDSIPRDAELVQVAREIDDDDRPVIVAGDLNDVAWSRTTCLFQRLTGMLDPRIGRGMYNSFHAKYPFARWPLDHVFFSPDFQLVRLERLGPIGSDHFPLLVALTLAPGRADRHDPPPSAADADWQQARATVEAARQAERDTGNARPDEG